MKLKESGPWAGVGGASNSSLGIPANPGANAQTFAQIADQGPNTLPAPGFPFRTKTAERVWFFAQFLILQEPLLTPSDIVRQAIAQSKQNINDLTPEDLRLLLMAVEWAQNGPAKAVAYTKGGPTRSDLSKLSTEARLQEYVGGISFAGPEPGKIGPVLTRTGGDIQSPFEIAQVKERKKKNFKDKFEKKRKALYSLALWINQRRNP